ncbi:MAG: arginine--tRNA ligase [bacterium]
MSGPVDPVTELRAAVNSCVEDLRGGSLEGGGVPTLERPPKVEFGDYSANAAMLLAPVLERSPREIAEELASKLEDALGDRIERIEVAGPGFLNLFMSDAWYRGTAAGLAAAGDDLGRPPQGVGGTLLIEFVSANPTGPLTAAAGRHASYGDSVARLLEFTGTQAIREYYMNDMGAQMERFGLSIGARMKGEGVPEDGYEGDYVVEIAERLAADGLAADDPQALSLAGEAIIVEGIRETLSDLGVEFDHWSSERALHDAGSLQRALDDLSEHGHIYEKDGATWIRSTEFGDDKDRVLLRSGGEPTYFLGDVAYHRDKLERYPEATLFDVLGADHHGYVSRIKASVEALGFGDDRLEISIMQLVNVAEGGEKAQMSKRRGEFVTLESLIEDIGADATRFFMLQRSNDTTVDLDLDLARQTSSDNPVYYVQYAHARISSILRKAAEEGAATPDASGFTGTVDPSERQLIKRISELPAEVLEAAERRAPHRICAYAMATAADFHAFYRDCQVVGAEGEGVEASRLSLCQVTRQTLATALGLLGISAPERM